MYTNDEKEFTGIFFQYNIMKVISPACPKLIMVDTTYKLNELRIPLYLILIVDGNGKCEIVGLYLTSLETREAISEMIRWFNIHNSPWKSTRLILTDKDFVVRAELLLCLFFTHYKASDEKSPLKRWVYVLVSVVMFLNYVKS